jgi:hypothetical protein
MELREELGLDGSIFQEDSSPAADSLPDWDGIAAHFARSRDLSLRFLDSALMRS